MSKNTKNGYALIIIIFLVFKYVLVSTMSKHSELSRSFGYAGQVNADINKTRQKQSLKQPFQVAPQ